MDPVTLGVGVAVSVVIIVVLMAITKFGFQGETDYENTIARQKEVLLDDSKPKISNKKKLKVDKRQKSSSAKAKTENPVTTSASDGESTAQDEEPKHLAHHHVEYEPDPVMIDETDVTVPSSRAQEAAPAKKILHNKGEVPLVSNEAVVENPVLFKVHPKDDVELKHEKEKKGKKTKHSGNQRQKTPVVDEIIAPSVAVTVAAEAPKSKSKKEKPGVQSSAPVPVSDEIVVPTTVSTVSAQSPVDTKSQVSDTEKPAAAKKPKSKKSADDHSLDSIMENIQRATLTKDELQTLVESILARQSEDTWTTKAAKPSPLAVLRKQLEETQDALEAERSNASSAQARVKELMSKLQTSEKSSSSAGVQINELQRKLREAHQTNERQTTELRNNKQQLEQGDKRIKDLLAESQKLDNSNADTDKVAQIQSNLADLTAENQRITTELEESKKKATSLQNQTSSLQDDLKTLENAKQELARACDEAKEKFSQSSAECQEALGKAAESERNCKNLQDQMKNLLKEKETQVQEVKMELLTLKEQLEQQQLTSNGAINGSHSDGDANGVSTNNVELEEKLSRLETSLSEKDSQIQGLNKQLAAASQSKTEIKLLNEKLSTQADKSAAFEIQVSTLQVDLQKMKEKNNALIRKTWLLNEALEAAECAVISPHTGQDGDLIRLEDLNCKLKTENDSLTQECTDLKKTVESLEEVNKQLTSIRAESEKQDKAITDLRDSHRSELEKYEKLSADKSQKIQQLETRIQQLDKDVDTLRGEKESLETRLSELPAPSSGLSTDNYKEALAQTELMLDQLIVKTKEEDKNWSVKLESKDKELSTLKERLDNLSKELSGAQQTAQLLEEADARAAAEASKVNDLSSQLEASNKKLGDLQSEFEAHKLKTVELTSQLSKVGNSLKDEQLKNRQLAQHLATAMAANGAEEDAGTCV